MRTAGSGTRGASSTGTSGPTCSATRNQAIGAPPSTEPNRHRTKRAARGSVPDLQAKNQESKNVQPGATQAAQTVLAVDWQIRCPGRCARSAPTVNAGRIAEGQGHRRPEPGVELHGREAGFRIFLGRGSPCDQRPERRPQACTRNLVPDAAVQRPVQSFAGVSGVGAAAAPATAPDELQARRDSGNLDASDFKGLNLGQTGEWVAALAKGNADQRANLARLMTDPAFAGPLKTALEQLAPSDRTQVFKAMGEIDNPVSRILAFTTLHTALGKMEGSERNDLLREALAGGNSAAARTVNQYFAARPEAAAELLGSVAGDKRIDDPTLASVLKGLDTRSLSGALKSLSAGSTEDAQRLFKRLGSAVYTSKEDGGIRSQLEKALNSMPPASRVSLLDKVISDKSGTRETDQEVNLGHHLAAQYLERLEPGEVKGMLDSIAPVDPMADAPKVNPFDAASRRAYDEFADKVDNDPAQQLRDKFERFIKKNCTNEKVQRAADRPEPILQKTVARADNALDELNKAPSFAHFGPTMSMSKWRGPHDAYVDAVHRMPTSEMEEHFRKLSTEQASTLVNILSPDPSYGYNYTDEKRLALVDEVVKNGGPASRARLAAGMAKTFQDDPPNDSNKEIVRAQVARLLKHDPNGAIREMSADDLQNVAKVFMAHPANLEKLNELLPKLDGQSAARLMHAVSVIAPEVAAEAKDGTWVGDFFKGLSITGKAGVSGGPANQANPSREIGFAWSPAALVDGNRQRASDQVSAQFRRFMSGWMEQLNKMSPNQKAIFTAKLNDVVQPKVS